MSLLAFISTGWLIFLALAILVGLANLILGSQTYARRCFTKVAREMGLSYDPEAMALRSLGCDNLPVLICLKARRNLLHGTVAGVETVCVEAGKEGQIEDPLVPNVFSTLICFRQPGRALPAFQLIKHDGKGERVLEEPGVSRPEHYSVVELRDNPGFSNIFLLLALQKVDEAALRALFPKPVQDFFMENRDSLWDARGAAEWVGVLGAHFADIALGSAVKEFRSHVDLPRRVHEMFVGKSD